MRIAACLAGIAAAMASLSAHHNHVGFDQSKPVSIEGTVTKVEWFNPHAFIWVAVKGADGSVTTWQVEASSPNGLQRAGITREMLAAETALVVTGFREDGGHTRLSATALRLTNGRDVPLPSFAADPAKRPTRTPTQAGAR